MEVRRGVLRCSSRKLRSSSFVELVADNKDKGISQDKVRTDFGTSAISSEEEIPHENFVSHLASMWNDE